MRALGLTPSCYRKDTGALERGGDLTEATGQEASRVEALGTTLLAPLPSTPLSLYTTLSLLVFPANQLVEVREKVIVDSLASCSEEGVALGKHQSWGR